VLKRLQDGSQQVIVNESPFKLEALKRGQTCFGQQYFSFDMPEFKEAGAWTIIFQVVEDGLVRVETPPILLDVQPGYPHTFELRGEQHGKQSKG